MSWPETRPGLNLRGAGISGLTVFWQVSSDGRGLDGLHVLRTDSGDEGDRCVMTAQPSVSVVMGVHNGGVGLRRSLESVLRQEDVDLELIVIDDGSDDDTAAILAEYALRDTRVKVVAQSNNGLTRALTLGCGMARGEYIARQDAGDVSLPSRLRIQKAVLDASRDLVFVSCWTEFVSPDLEVLFVKKGTGAAKEPTLILNDIQDWGAVDGPTCHPSVMFRKSSYLCAGGYRDAFYFGQDWDLWYRLAAIGRFQMIERVLYQAEAGTGISLQYRTEQHAFAELAREALRFRRRGLSDEGILEMARQMRPEPREQSKRTTARGFYFIGECLRRRGDARARTYFRRAISADQLAWRAWLRLVQMGVLAD